MASIILIPSDIQILDNESINIYKFIDNIYFGPNDLITKVMSNGRVFMERTWKIGEKLDRTNGYLTLNE